MKKKRLALNKKIIIIIIILILAIAVSSLTLTGNSIKDLFKLKPETSGSQGSGTVKKIVVTKQNLPAFLQRTNLVQELHKNAEIELRLFNRNKGYWEAEETYIIKKSQVTEGKAKDPDVVAFIDSKYIGELNNFCPTMQKARANRDLDFEFKKSTPSLLWKYKGMMKYKPCFGF